MLQGEHLRQPRNQMDSKRWGTDNGGQPAADSLYDPYGNDWYVCAIYGSGASSYADFGIYCACFGPAIHPDGRPYFPRYARWLSPDSPLSQALLDPNDLNAYGYDGGDPLNNHEGPNQLVPPEVRKAIAASVKASNSKTTDDTKGGYHEEGGTWGTDLNTGETVVSPAKPGPVSSPGDKEATIDPGNAVNPDLNQQMMPEGEWHVHPRGGDGVQFGQPPSTVDIENSPFDINIVVGAGNSTVYFYDSSGIVQQMSLKNFMKEP